MSERRLDRNIYRTQYGYRVKWRGPSPTTRTVVSLSQRFTLGQIEGALALGADLARDLIFLRAFRDAKSKAATLPSPQPTRHASGFAADARAYLTTHLPTLDAPRTREIEIEKWIEVFGATPRHEITKDRANAELRALLKAGYASSTVAKFKRALQHVWTILDGKDAPNPILACTNYREAPIRDYSQPIELIHSILDCIDDIASVPLDRDTIYEEVWREPVTKVAERYGFTATFLKRRCRQMNVPTPDRGYWAKAPSSRALPPRLPARGSNVVPDQLKTRSRLEVAFATALEHKQIGRLVPGVHFNLRDRWYVIPNRAKNPGQPEIRIKMSAAAHDAFTRLVEAQATGPYDSSAAYKTWQRACRRYERERRESEPGYRLPHIRVKDLRHSFATNALEKGGDLNAVRILINHRPDSRMTLRYTLKGQATMVATTIEKIDAQAPPREPRTEGRKSGQKIVGAEAFQRARHTRKSGSKIGRSRK